MGGESPFVVKQYFSRTLFTIYKEDVFQSVVLHNILCKFTIDLYKLRCCDRLHKQEVESKLKPIMDPQIQRTKLA